MDFGPNVEFAADLHRRGVEFHDAGKRAEAEVLYLRAIALEPDHVRALQDLACVYLETGRSDRAIPIAEKAIAVAPKNADMHCLLAIAYKNLRRTQEAVEAYDRALALDPQNAVACNNYAVIMLRLGRFTDAISRLETVLAVADQVKNVPVVNAGAGAVRGTGEEEAKAFKGAILANMGNAWLQLMEPEKALAYQRASWALSDVHPNARSNSLRAMGHIPSIPPEEILREHKLWWVRHGVAEVPAEYRNTRDADRPLKIGFISGDFREHSVIHFLLGLFENIDPAGFQFIAYSESPIVDEYSKRLQARCTAWRRSLGVKNADVAQQIQRDEIDILIDLSGHTSGNRLGVFAHRPAPVQVTWLGYPMTTGSPVIDWRISDPIADPPGMTDSHYSERLLRLPRTAWCYRPPVDLPANEIAPSARGDGRGFTFGSFSNASKISSMTFELWARVLRAVPASRMLIKAHAMVDEGARKHVLKALNDRGIAEDRIELVSRQMKLEEHLAQYENVDVALDTYPYNGTTTICEALWMNVPVVTLAGATHISRVGASLLTNAGLGELVANNETAYVEMASRLGREPPALARVRQGLREKFKASAVMDEAGFAADFGAAMRDIWKQWVGGKVGAGGIYLANATI